MPRSISGRPSPAGRFANKTASNDGPANAAGVQGVATKPNNSTTTRRVSLGSIVAYPLVLRRAIDAVTPETITALVPSLARRRTTATADGAVS